MSLLETFICSLDVTGVVLEPNINENTDAPAEAPFTIFFDLDSGKFTNDVGGDFTVTAAAQGVRDPWYVFSINGYAIGSRGVNETGIFSISNNHLTPPTTRNPNDTRPDWENRARVAEMSRHGRSGYFGQKSHFYDFLVNEQLSNIDPSSVDSIILNVDVYEYDEGDGPYKASIKSGSTIFPKPHTTTGELPTPVASNAIKIKVSTAATRDFGGGLTNQQQVLSTNLDLTNTDNLAQIDLESVGGTFFINENESSVIASNGYEVVSTNGLTATIDEEGNFEITSVTSLNDFGEATVIFRANHEIMINDVALPTSVESTFTLKVQSNYVAPTPPPLDYGINYDEILGNITISPYRLCNFNYNFHMEKYESLISSDSISHNLLPCYYNNTFYLNNKEMDSNYSLQEAVKSMTLNERIPTSANPSLSIPSTSKITKAQEVLLKKHYNNVGVALHETIRSGETDLEDISSNMSYKMISDTEYDKFLESEDSKKVFPFYNEISIPKARTGDYGKILEKYKKFDDFKVLNNLFADIPSIPVAYNGEETSKRLQIANLLGDTENTLYGNEQTEDSYMVYADPADTNLLTVSMLEYETLDTEDFMLIDKIIKNKITLFENNEITSQQQKSYSDDQASIGGESEILYYKIKKYEKAVGLTPITTICIPNKGNTTTLKYIDTQVKPNKDYHYVVEAIILCKSNSEDDSGNYYLLQEQITTIHNVTLNKPPMPIDFNIQPYLGEDRDNNKIRIKMNQSVGSGFHEVITLDDEEEERAQRIRVSQGRDGQGEESITGKMGYQFIFPPEQFEDTVLFDNDDPIKVYEIYRLENPPQSIQDFSIANVFRTVENFYEDVLEYNKDYYYMVRGIDSHGNISNPSPIIRVMIVNEGKMYAVIRPYSFDEYPIKIHNTFKKVGKFLRISPLPSDIIVTEDENSVVSIGGNNSSLWNKDYKVRVTSNTSGKMLDINFKFVRENSLGNETN